MVTPDASSYVSVGSALESIQTTTGTTTNVTENLTTTLIQLQAQMSAIEEKLERIPLQFHNSKIPFNSPLKYPTGTRIVQGMPIYKRDICNLLDVDCMVTAKALDLPALPEPASLAQMRAQIGDFLGAI